ncbi:MAG: hypothetical protein ACRDQ2_17610 [Gaiellales bacterium]
MLTATCASSSDPPSTFLSDETRGRPTAIPTLPSDAGLLGVKWDWPRVETYRPQLETLPGGETWQELVWCDVERARGAPDWSAIDEVVDDAARLGFVIHLKIRVGSCWVTDRRLGERGRLHKTASLLPTDLEAYRAFVRSAVIRYAPKGVHRYAIENEANGESFWQSSAADYDALARVASAAIRESDPGAVVLDSGISATAYGVGLADWLLRQGDEEEALAAYHRYYARRFDRRTNDFPRVNDTGELNEALQREQARRNLDFLQVTFGLAHDHVIDAYQLHFYEPWQNVPLLMEFLRSQLPAAMPVEAWEVGIFWPDAPPGEAVLAAEEAKLISLLLAAGVRTVIWLPAAFNAEGRQPREIRWGLFDPQGRPRLLASVFGDLARAAAGSDVQPVGRNGIEGVAFGSVDGTVLVLWSGDTTQLGGPPPQGATARHLDGELRSWGEAGLEVRAEPIIIQVPQPSEAALALISAPGAG